MESKQKQQRRQPKPKLERRNAIKNIDYDYDDSSSSSLRTRSLDLSACSVPDDRTSFRIVGGSDGEIDIICRSLGLSGPEDFAIPISAWEANKARSVSSPSSFPYSRFYGPSPTSPNDDTTTTTTNKLDAEDDLSYSFRDEFRITEPPPTVLENSPAQPSSRMMPSSSSIARGGIKGVRPPVLAPPPSRLLTRAIDGGSTWDILKDFGPPADNNIRKPISTSSSDAENDEEQGGVIRLGETALHLSASCSFSTSHDGDDEDDDGDSSSSTTDPMYVISPGGFPRIKRIITLWRKGTLLGSGSFGTVYEGLSDDGFFFAVKEVSLLDQGTQAKQSIYQLEQEISLLSKFEHENIVQYYGTDKDEEKLYIFLELVTQGSLAKLYQKYHLADTLVSAYTRQILHGLKYLHDRNVVHRDIKCANILVDANGSVKLADFGLAKATRFNDVQSCKGTAFWMAPEVVNRRNHGYGLPADIWSLGCTVLEMLTRQLPYSNLECMQALFRIGKGKPPPVPNSISGAARDFILQCLQVSADDRPTAAQLLDHPFVDKPLPVSSASASPSPSHINWRRN